MASEKTLVECPYCKAKYYINGPQDICEHIIFSVTGLQEDLKLIYDEGGRLITQLEQRGLPIAIVRDYLDYYVDTKSENKLFKVICRKVRVEYDSSEDFGGIVKSDRIYYCSNKKGLINELLMEVDKNLEVTYPIKLRTLYHLIYFYEKLKSPEGIQSASNIKEEHIVFLDFFKIPDFIWELLKELGKIPNPSKASQDDFVDRCFKDVSEGRWFIQFLREHDKSLDYDSLFYSESIEDFMPNVLLDLPKIKSEINYSYLKIFEDKAKPHLLYLLNRSYKDMAAAQLNLRRVLEVIIPKLEILLSEDKKKELTDLLKQKKGGAVSKIIFFNDNAHIIDSFLRNQLIYLWNVANMNVHALDDNPEQIETCIGILEKHVLKQINELFD